MSNPEASAKSALGLDGNITALLCYLVGIIGVILAFIEKDNKFVRFHAWQSFLFGIAVAVLSIVLVIVGFVILGLSVGAAAAGSGVIGSIMGLLFWLFILLCVVLSFAAFAGVIFAAVKGYQGEIFKLPLIGNYAEKFANK